MSRASFRELALAVFAVLAMLLPAPVVAQASPSAFTSATRYDLMHRVTGTIAPAPDGGGSIHYAAVRNTYDIAGRLVKVEKGELAAWQSETIAPASWSGFTVFQTVDTTYDLLERKLAEQVSSGDTAYTLTQYSYDAVGRPQCTTVRMNPSVYGSLPPSACTLGTAGGQGDDRITRQVYDDVGQVLQVQKAYATALQQNYATYTYSANGKQVSMTDANGNKAGMTWDGLDRQAAWNFPSPTVPGTVSATDYEAYTYDPDGNRLSLRKRDGQVIHYSYDALERMVVKDIPGGTAADVYYGYDAWGRPLYARFGSAAGAGITNTFDGFGRQLGTTSNMDGTSRALSYQYDADGNRIRLTYPDTTYFTASYDGLDRPSAILQGGTTPVVSMTYDAQGQRIGETRGGVASVYGYDPISRLAGLSDDLAGTASDVAATFAYNPASQITVKTRTNDAYAFTGYATATTAYVANGLNQYATVGAATLGYDANGNLTANGTTTYAYDVENRLISASIGVTLDYDPLGRLWRMTASGVTTRFLDDGDALVEERDGTGTLLRRYVHGYGEDDPLLWYEGSGLTDRRSLQVDSQGSIVSVADAGGTALGIDSYDEYGVPASGNIGRFQYTGQAYLPALGLYYYKARMYAPRLGRFLQTDPIGYKDQNNLYTYVGNDPVDGTDSSGAFGLFGGCPAGSSCLSSNPDSSNAEAGSALPTNRRERVDINKGSEAGVNDYWTSRCDRGDPVGCIAPNYRSDGSAGGLAKISRAELYGEIAAQHIVNYRYHTGGKGEAWWEPVYDEKAIHQEYVAIRWDLAWSHMRSVDHDKSGVIGWLSASQIESYHLNVFHKYGLPNAAYGPEIFGWLSRGPGNLYVCSAGRGCDSQ